MSVAFASPNPSHSPEPHPHLKKKCRYKNMGLLKQRGRNLYFFGMGIFVTGGDSSEIGVGVIDHVSFPITSTIIVFI